MFPVGILEFKHSFDNLVLSLVSIPIRVGNLTRVSGSLSLITAGLVAVNLFL